MGVSLDRVSSTGYMKDDFCVSAQLSEDPKFLIEAGQYFVCNNIPTFVEVAYTVICNLLVITQPQRRGSE